MLLSYCYGKLRNYYQKWKVRIIDPDLALNRFRVYMTSRFAKKGIVRVRSAIIAMTVYFFLIYIAFELSVPLFPSRPAQ
jgi:hypothetical protein